MADSLISPDAARAVVLAEVVALEAEAVALEEAAGRVLAEDVRAVEAVPAFASSAMDGYAVRAADTASAAANRPAVLALAGESRAGAPSGTDLAAGTAVRISTGAMLPAGADAVVRQEDVDADGAAVRVRAPVAAGHDVRGAGESVQPGAAVLARGTALGPMELGVLASIGRAGVRCARRPRVAIVTTGDELAAPGAGLAPGGVYDATGFAVPAQARRAGAGTRVWPRVRDAPDATRGALAAGLEADVLVVCGGVSVGPHDHVKPALAELGVAERFWRVALAPGKPTWFGVHERAGRRTLVFGLPGNPVSAVVTFQLFVRPALRALLGADPAARRVRAVLDEAVTTPPGRTHAIRCRAEARDDGWHARTTGPQGSHVLTSMLDANALALVGPDGGARPAGERVTLELLD